MSRVGGKFDWGGTRHCITAEHWLKHMAKRSAWIDQAFLALAADCFAVEILYYVVSGKGAIGQTCVVEPRESVHALARVELAYLVDKHFCAVIPCGEGGEGEAEAETRDAASDAAATAVVSLELQGARTMPPTQNREP